jgi:hypothetical protein
MIIARTPVSFFRLSSLDSYSEQTVSVENFLTNGYYEEVNGRLESLVLCKAG